MRRPRLLFALSLLAALAAGWGWRLIVPAPPLHEDRYLPALFPGAERFSAKEGNPPRYTALVRGPEGFLRPGGIAFLTSEILPAARGYGGPLHLLVGLHPDGTLAGMRVVRHAETPSYAAVIQRPAFGDRYSGKSLADPFKPGEDVDAISRATITSVAIAGTVRDAGRIMAREALELDVLPPEGGRRRLPWGRATVVAVMVLGALVIHRWNRPLPRLIFLGVSAGVLGFWLGIYLSLGQVAALLTGRGSPFLAHLDWYLLLAASILLAALLGNLFCGYLCPFGAVQELLARFGGRRGAAPPAVPPTLAGATRWRWFFLWITLLAAFLLGYLDATAYEPFATLFDRRGGHPQWLLLGVVLAGGLVLPRLWCRFFCPVGALLQTVPAVGRFPAPPYVLPEHRFPGEPDGAADHSPGAGGTAAGPRAPSGGRASSAERAGS